CVCVCAETNCCKIKGISDLSQNYSQATPLDEAFDVGCGEAEVAAAVLEDIGLAATVHGAAGGGNQVGGKDDVVTIPRLDVEQPVDGRIGQRDRVVPAAGINGDGAEQTGVDAE